MKIPFLGRCDCPRSLTSQRRGYLLQTQKCLEKAENEAMSIFRVSRDYHHLRGSSISRSVTIIISSESRIFCKFQGKTTTITKVNLSKICCLQMNKLLVREITKNDSTFGFELEKQDNRVSPNRKRGEHAKEDNSVIVVQCESEAQRDEWLKTINDQVSLKNFCFRVEKRKFLTFFRSGN